VDEVLLLVVLFYFKGRHLKSSMVEALDVLIAKIYRYPFFALISYWGDVSFREGVEYLLQSTFGYATVLIGGCMTAITVS
jgi:hypothetical protein